MIPFFVQRRIEYKRTRNKKKKINSFVKKEFFSIDIKFLTCFVRRDRFPFLHPFFDTSRIIRRRESNEFLRKEKCFNRFRIFDPRNRRTRSSSMIKSGDPRVIPVDPLFAGNKQFSVNRTEVDRVDRVDREDRVNTGWTG